MFQSVLLPPMNEDSSFVHRTLGMPSNGLHAKLFQYIVCRDVKELRMETIEETSRMVSSVNGGYAFSWLVLATVDVKTIVAPAWWG